MLTREQKITMMIEIHFGKTMNWIKQSEDPEEVERVREAYTKLQDDFEKILKVH